MTYAEAVKLAEYWKTMARQELSHTDRDAEALAVLSALAEENERLKEQLRIVHGELRHECEVAEKAEAELERARPLLEAVEKAETFTTEAGLLRFSLYPEMKGIIEKALAYRSA